MNFPKVCPEKKLTGLNIIISVVQKVYEWPGCSHEGIILQKGQLVHSYTFWIMPIMIFSLLSNSSHQPLGINRFYQDRKKVWKSDGSSLYFIIKFDNEVSYKRKF